MDGDQVFDVMATLLSLTWKHGVTILNWLLIWNVMIEKLPGNPRIDKLRVIHIFDSLWNLSLGIIWGKRLQQQCEKLGIINDGQWGSRSGRVCAEVVLIKLLTYEISRLTRTDLITFDNDAKACYDRMVMAFCLLRCQQLGLPMNACVALGAFLDRAIYHLRTSMGVSEEHYQSTKSQPLHGPGQGAKNAPSFWTIVSSCIMDCLEEKFDGTTFTDPEMLMKVKRIIDGFVDDTTLWVNDFERELNLYNTGEHRYTSSDAIRILHEMIDETSQTAQW